MVCFFLSVKVFCRCLSFSMLESNVMNDCSLKLQRNFENTVLKLPICFHFGNLFTSKYNANDAFFYINERLHILYYTHPYHFYRSRLNIRIVKFSCNWSYKVYPRNISLDKSHQRYVQTISFYIFSLKVILL